MNKAQTISPEILKQVSDTLNRIMLPLATLTDHPPECHLCKADLALGLAAVLKAGAVSDLMDWSVSYYHALLRLAKHYTELHEQEGHRACEEVIQANNPTELE